jgi:hypothetical protein
MTWIVWIYSAIGAIATTAFAVCCVCWAHLLVCERRDIERKKYGAEALNELFESLTPGRNVSDARDAWRRAWKEPQ